MQKLGVEAGFVARVVRFLDMTQGVSVIEESQDDPEKGVTLTISHGTLMSYVSGLSDHMTVLEADEWCRGILSVGLGDVWNCDSAEDGNAEA